MKKTILVIFPCLLLSTLLLAQSVGINNNTPHASAMLDVKSNTKGMLLPRTSTTSRLAIVSPAKGLILYDSTTSGFWFYNGSAWAQLSIGNNGWNLTGNAVTNPATNFIGSTNEQPLRFRVNNTWAGEIHPTNGNLFWGLSAGQATTLGEANTATGYFALAANTEGNFNVATGYYALPVNINGYNNTALGTYALSANNSGIANTATGRNALFANTTGGYNTATGVDALLSNIAGTNNVATGYRALYSSNAAGNTANGYQALYSNTSGYDNTAMGNLSLYANITGSLNTAVGHNASLANTFGNANVAIGDDALKSNTTGHRNTAIGAIALDDNVGGGDNIAIGAYSGTAFNAPNVSNTVSIGNIGMETDVSNKVTIGNGSTVLIGGKVNWSVYSDARIKNNITEDVKGLDFIARLRPVTYYISNKAMTTITGSKGIPNFPGKYDGEKIKYTGFVAQEVEQAAKAAGYDFSGYSAPKNERGLYTVSYAEFVVPLVKGMQEQQSIIETLKKQVELLEERLAILETK